VTVNPGASELVEVSASGAVTTLAVGLTSPTFLTRAANGDVFVAASSSIEKIAAGS
jgi:hypothetical protein